MQGERRAFADGGVDAHTAAVSQNDMLRNGQAQASAAKSTAASFIDTIEAFPESRKVLGSYTAAAVTNRDGDFLPGACGCDFDGGFDSAVLDRVIDEID